LIDSRTRQSLGRTRQTDMDPSTLSSWALLIAEALRSRGIDAADLFRRAHMPPAQLQDPNARYPVRSMQRLWTLAVEATGDPCLGLDVGAAWHPTSFHALGYSALAARSLREALILFGRYCRVVSTGVRADVLDEHGEVSVRLSILFRDVPASESAVRAAMLAALASVLALCRAVRGASIDPVRVTFSHADDGACSRVQSFFRCPVVFGAPQDALVFSAHELDRELNTANPTLLRINEQAIANYAARLKSADVVESVRAELIRQLPSGEVDQTAVARSLNMSLRSMQRKLKHSGTNFRALLDETRGRLAEQYCHDSTLSATELAFLVGFSDPSSLSRAMRRWNRQKSPTAPQN